MDLCRHRRIGRKFVGQSRRHLARRLYVFLGCESLGDGKLCKDYGDADAFKLHNISKLCILIILLLIFPQLVAEAWHSTFDMFNGVLFLSD